LLRTRTVKVLGSGAVLSSNVAKAKDRAVSNSLVVAVSQVADELLPKNGMVTYFQELNQTLFQDAEIYIQDYKVLTEFMSDNIYRVVVEATVSIDGLEKKLLDAGLIWTQKSLPKVLFLVVEHPLGDVFPRFWWSSDFPLYKAHSESAMAEVMGESGYTIVDYRNVILPADLTELGQKTRLSNEKAIRIGHHSTAEVLIIGDALVQKATNIMGADKKTFKGIVSVRAIRSNTGEEIAYTRQTAITMDTDEIRGGLEALVQAGRLAGNELSIQLAAMWQRISVSPEQIIIVVQGTSDLSSFVLFRKSLNEMSGVDGIFIKEMKPDEASIIVDYQGNASTLAEALMLNTFDSFGINIYETTQNRLKIKLLKHKFEPQ